jgi:hypothetical protein
MAPGASVDVQGRAADLLERLQATGYAVMGAGFCMASAI